MTESKNAYFFEYMQELLGARYDAFKFAYDNKPRHKALRVNTLKITPADFKAICGYELKQNPLCDASFYCNVKPSLDPLYHAGLYYMQEPSASAAVAAFAPYIGERVLDLCAAPGGKTTQAAALMHGGALFCNDKDYKRTKALTENIERLGIKNAIVTCNTASDYRRAGFDGYFDTLIVDAPCSGGGMMRYEEVPFTRDIVMGCAMRQREILRDAAELLERGGYMLYSTCTFPVDENENNVNFLCSLGFEPVDVPLTLGTERGIGISQARRIYPIDFDGEGHFYCILKKTGVSTRCDKPSIRKKRSKVKLNSLEIDAVEIGKRIMLPIECPVLDGLNVVRLSVPIFDENRDPSYALIHALDQNSCSAFGTVEIGEIAEQYIRGSQIDMAVPKGNLIATVRDYAIGLVKSAPSGDGVNVLKNKYDKRFRI